VLNRARGACEDCGEHIRLEIHHLTYLWDDPQEYKLRTQEPIWGHETPDDLTALCRDCHRGRHVFLGEFFANIDELNELRESWDISWERD
jgi:hypothetical protein